MSAATSVIGTVLAVDRVNGTVDAQLRSGLTITAVYLTTPPWRGTNARFVDVGAGSWICEGSQGDLGGYGPNLIANGEFEQDTTGWDNTASKAWNFDGTTESWVAGASTSLAVGTTIVYNGTGSLSLTATAAATIGATSPTGTGGVGSIVPGTTYNASCWITNDPNKASRVASLRVNWYTAAGALISNSAFGATVATDPATWRAMGCTATAPALAAFAALEVSIASAALGDIFYLDTAVITGGAGATIARDGANFYTGAASISVTSTASGLAYAQTPSPATDPLGGIPVTPGDVLYVDCRFRQPNGLSMFIVAAWVFADGSTVADFNLDSRSPAGTSSFKYHLQTFIAPSGAVAVHFAFAFIASAGAQVLNIDSIQIRQALLNPGLGLVSVTPAGFSWSIGGKAQQPGYALWIPSETDFPRLVINGYLSQRSLHARLRRISVADANIAQGLLAPTLVAMDTVDENNGMVCSADGTTAGSYIQVPRTGYYNVTGKLTWKNWAFGAGSTGGDSTEVWAYSSDGSTPLRMLAVMGTAPDAPTAGFGYTSSAPETARINRDERVYLACRTGISTGGHGITTAQTTLQVTYVGDA